MTLALNPKDQPDDEPPLTRRSERRGRHELTGTQRFLAGTGVMLVVIIVVIVTGSAAAIGAVVAALVLIWMSTGGSTGSGSPPAG